MAVYPFRYRYGYTRDHYLVGGNPERDSYAMKTIRPGDMGAALAYSLGSRTYEDVVKILEIDTSVPYYLPEGTSCIEQAKQLARQSTRDPNLVIDIGCGRGEIAGTLAYMGIGCIAVDPAKGAAVLIGRTFREFFNMSTLPTNTEFINKSAFEGMWEIKRRGLRPDTVIFCESIEHISHKEFLATFEIIKMMLADVSGMLVITNWIDYHPIQKNNDMDWNHIATINDTLYDSLAAQAKKVVFRRGSHLVLQF